MTELSEGYNEVGMPLPSHPKFSIGAAAVFAVDQAIVDGLVDGGPRRVRLTVLAGIGFAGQRVESETMTTFVEQLPRDSRYIDRVKQQAIAGWMYGFEPVVTEGSLATPSPKAIVEGTAIVSDKIFANTIWHLQVLADVFLETLDPRVNALPLDGLKKLFEDTETPLSHGLFHGLIAYMRMDRRFGMPQRSGGKIKINPDARTMSRDESFMRPFSEAELSDIVEESLPHIRPGEDGTFSTVAMRGASKAVLGMRVRGRQVPALERILASHPDVTPLRNGRFKYFGPSNEDAQTDLEKPRASSIGMDDSLQPAARRSVTKHVSQSIEGDDHTATEERDSSRDNGVENPHATDSSHSQSPDTSRSVTPHRRGVELSGEVVIEEDSLDAMIHGVLGPNAGRGAIKPGSRSRKNGGIGHNTRRKQM